MLIVYARCDTGEESLIKYNFVLQCRYSALRARIIGRRCTRASCVGFPRRCGADRGLPVRDTRCEKPPLNRVRRSEQEFVEQTRRNVTAQ